MSHSSHSYTPATDVKENQFNKRYNTGDSVNFSFNNTEKILNGIILKKYTNSCLLDISDNHLTFDETRTYKGKMVISYKGLRINN